MISFPNCKINLGLNVVEKRDDGFHNIETVFLPINIKDALEIIVAEDATKDISFTTTGLTIEGDIKQNLCVKAYKLLKKDFDLPSIQMHLHKAIPMGAGLGGGSADGAFALMLMNDKFNLNLSNEQLINYALQLGSDCPFFSLNKPCFATSRGEVLKAIDIDLSAYQIIVINPKIHISTAWAFGNIVPSKSKKSVEEIIQQPISTWRKELINDFEKPVFKKYSAVEDIKQILYHHNAIFASMTGTGSTVFGIFNKTIDPAIFNFPANYFVQILTH